MDCCCVGAINIADASQKLVMEGQTNGALALDVINRFLAVGLLAAVLPFAPGCVTNKTTTTARSGTEELLLSTATDHALHNAGLEVFAGHNVYLDGTYFDSYDSKYVLATVRDALSRAGARLEDNSTNSEIVIEARSGALAINDSDSMFGIPALTVPVPLAGSVGTPEISFYKAQRQISYAKFALLAYARGSRAHVYSTGPLDGNSYDKSFRFLFISWARTDVPEKESTAEKAGKYQTWFPQNDTGNLPNGGSQPGKP